MAMNRVNAGRNPVSDAATKTRRISTMNDTNNANGFKRVLGVFAHPDDPEFFAGATFARWAAQGAEITFMSATRCGKVSAELDMTRERLMEIREDEERRAATAHRVKEVIFMHYSDVELEPSLDLRRDIGRVIRRKKPYEVV